MSPPCSRAEGRAGADFERAAVEVDQAGRVGAELGRRRRRLGRDLPGGQRAAVEVDDADDLADRLVGAVAVGGHRVVADEQRAPRQRAFVVEIDDAVAMRAGVMLCAGATVMLP